MRKKTQGRGEGKGKMGAADNSFLSHCLFWAVPLYVNVSPSQAQRGSSDKLVVYVPVG